MSKGWIEEAFTLAEEGRGFGDHESEALALHLARDEIALLRRGTAAAREEGRREGFEKAREMAEGLALEEAKRWGDVAPRTTAANVANRIRHMKDLRAMRDEAGEGPVADEWCANCGWAHSQSRPAKNAAGQVLCADFRPNPLRPA